MMKFCVLPALWVLWVCPVSAQQVSGSGANLVAGTDIGDVLGPLINFQGSGLPGLDFNNGLIVDRKTPTATDNGDFQFKRTTTFSGGTTANINYAVRVAASIGANDATQNWPLGVVATTNGTAGGILSAAYIQSNRAVGATDPFWGTVIDTRDLTDVASSVSGGAALGIELDLRSNRADDATNSATFGGVGKRKAFQINTSRMSTSDATVTDFSNGIWFGQGLSTGGTDTLSYVDSAIGFSTASQIIQALDTRGATAPASYSGPLAAVRMTAGHIIDFNGGAALNSAAGNYLTYNSGSTKLQYIVGSTEEFSVSNSGTIIVGNGPSISNSSGALAFSTASGIQAEVLDTASAANFVTLTGAAAGGDPLITVGGSDTNRNLAIRGKGTGSLRLTSTVTLGSAQTNFLQIAGAATSVAPELSTQGGDTNADLKLTPKGTGNLIMGNSSSFTANGSVATAMSSLGPTGSHATIQEWFTIKDSAGTVRYIPAF